MELLQTFLSPKSGQGDVEKEVEGVFVNEVAHGEGLREFASRSVEIHESKVPNCMISDKILLEQ